ncbi:MAG: hypothetical protein Q8K78_03800 [Planctomycetaceae bacterium]|nr:hypothetical protein [Planctomycetaceae bacterium]
MERPVAQSNDGISRRSMVASLTAGLTFLPFAECAVAQVGVPVSPIESRTIRQLQGRFVGGSYTFDVFQSGLIIAKGHGINRIGIGKYADQEFPNGDSFVLSVACKDCSSVSEEKLRDCIKKGSKEPMIEVPYWAYHLQGHWIDYSPDDPGKGHGSSGVFRIRWALDRKTNQELDVRASFFVNDGSRLNTGEGGMIENQTLTRQYQQGTKPPVPEDPKSLVPKWPIVVNNGWAGTIQEISNTTGEKILAVDDALVFSGPGYGYLAKKTDRQYLFNGAAIPSLKVSNAPSADDLIVATVVDPFGHRDGTLRLSFSSANAGSGVLALSNSKIAGGFDIAWFKFTNK